MEQSLVAELLRVEDELVQTVRVIVRVEGAVRLLRIPRLHPRQYTKLRNSCGKSALDVWQGFAAQREYTCFLGRPLCNVNQLAERLQAETVLVITGDRVQHLAILG